MIDLSSLVDDLADEHAALDAIVADLTDDVWDTPTPAPGWSVRDQISHLAFFDEQGVLAINSPQEFMDSLSLVTDATAFVEDPLNEGRAMTPADLLSWWRTARNGMLDGFRVTDPTLRVPWFGPPMSPASFISARLMETWAHGQDIVDALGVERTPTERLRHVAHLGVRARPFSYTANGLIAPDSKVGVSLIGPGGENWAWDDDAAESVSGSALDFCLVVTQRRHLNDTDLNMSGPLAREWMSMAQCFAGPPGEGRQPGQFK